MDKIKSKFGSNSKEYNYLSKIIEYCSDNGIVRFEQKLKPRFIQRYRYSHWGLSDYSTLRELHNQFINLDKTLSVTAMDFDTISEHLLFRGVVDSTRSANTTAMYAIQWMHGHSFDFNKKQVQTHRARLRKIGIDIAQRCNISKFSPVIVRNNKRNVVVSDCKIPDWYHKACHLKVA